MERNTNICVLIDADNISPKYIKGIFEEIAKYGSVQIKRLYGDLSDSNKKNWKDIALEYSITPIQQYNYTTGKNATDSSMIINAMDLLYTKDLDGFVIVSSDSDFTGLAARLREENKYVIGMGERKTPPPFIRACSEFKYLENLISETIEEEKDAIKDTLELKKMIIGMLSESECPLLVSRLTDTIRKTMPDFDPRNYGYSQMSKLLESFEDLELIKDGNTLEVKLKKSNQCTNTKKAEDEIIKIISDIIKQEPKKKINMGDLNKKLQEQLPDFNYKAYGYSKFMTFLTSIGEFKVKEYNVYLK
ncbi:MAG: NYN domain-containing protein [Bacilli bacterium]|nr:NYN domain-containing protein [Bacilli bacterium]